MNSKTRTMGLQLEGTIHNSVQDEHCLLERLGILGLRLPTHSRHTDRLLSDQIYQGRWDMSASITPSISSWNKPLTPLSRDVERLPDFSLNQVGVMLQSGS